MRVIVERQAVSGEGGGKMNVDGWPAANELTVSTVEALQGKGGVQC
jgi:hypothetical protein